MTARRRPVEYDEDVPHPLTRRIKIGAAILGIRAGIGIALFALPRLFPGEEQPAPVASLGQTFDAQDWSYSVLGVDRTDRLDITGKGDFASASGDWVIVNLSFVNRTDQPQGMDLDNFSLRDDKGRDFEIARAEQLIYVDEHNLLDINVEPFETTFEDVQPGAIAQVPLIFDVRREEAPLRLWLHDEEAGIALGPSAED